MKRSEMLEILAEEIKCNNMRVMSINKQADKILFLIEEIGMLPPAYFCEVKEKEIPIGPVNMWEPEC